MKELDPARHVSPMTRHVRQKHPKGCVVACLSMITGIPYDDVFRGFTGDRNVDGLSQFAYDGWLNQHGYVVLRRYLHYAALHADRAVWPCKPFADAHLCTVEIGDGSHAVVMDGAGVVLDPIKDAPGTLADYAKVSYIAGIYRVREAFLPEALTGLHWDSASKKMPMVRRAQRHLSVSRSLSGARRIESAMTADTIIADQQLEIAGLKEQLRLGNPAGADAKTPEKHYAHYLTTTTYFKLDVACIPLWRAFQSHGGVYLVGSVLRKPDWRDVDIRVILDDAEFDRLFPVTDKWGENAQWKIICISISHYLSSVTGLPIDFQIQRQTQANEQYSRDEDHRRNAIGLFHKYD